MEWNSPTFYFETTFVLIMFYFSAQVKSWKKKKTKTNRGKDAGSGQVQNIPQVWCWPRLPHLETVWLVLLTWVLRNQPLFTEHFPSGNHKKSCSFFKGRIEQLEDTSSLVCEFLYFQNERMLLEINFHVFVYCQWLGMREDLSKNAS